MAAAAPLAAGRGLTARTLRRLGLAYFAEIENLNCWMPLVPLAVSASRENRILRSGLPCCATNLVCLARNTGA